MSLRLLSAAIVASIFFGSDVPAPPAAGQVVVDDFDQEAIGELPSRWRFLNSRTRNYDPLERYMAEDERFYVVEEGGRVFLRGYTDGEAQRISMPNESDHLEWDLRSHSRLRWDWRAIELPDGASERSRNDTGGALYITFRTDWLGRPQSIKYTYSSSLPVNTVVSFGRLKVIVAASAIDGIGEWQTVTRDVVADYRMVFDRDPPDKPLSITLWSDSDDTRETAIVDYDNIVLVE